MKGIISKIEIVILLAIFSTHIQAIDTSGKLLLTGGTSQIEGSAGGGLTPWALIGSYATRDQIGANAFYTKVTSSDYSLEGYGALVGLYNRVELSLAKQSFNTEKVGSLLGLKDYYKLEQNILGVKVRLIGDAVLDQDSWIPQISIGVQVKENLNEKVVKSIKANSHKDNEYYISATKIILNHSLLYNLTLRRTKANQLGILGFGGDKSNDYQIMPELSLAYLIQRNLAIGAEYREKPSNLKLAKEEGWYDIFIAWTPTKNISLTMAYAHLGNIVLKDNQQGLYSSLQIGF